MNEAQSGECMMLFSDMLSDRSSGWRVCHVVSHSSGKLNGYLGGGECMM